MNNQWLQVYRFGLEPAGEIAIPSAALCPSAYSGRQAGGLAQISTRRGAWIWRDTSGDGTLDRSEFVSNDNQDLPEAQGWWVDDAGNVWLATETEGIVRFPLQGLDERGNPVWNFRSRQVFPKPSGFEKIKRLRYDPGYRHDVSRRHDKRAYQSALETDGPGDLPIQSLERRQQKAVVDNRRALRKGFARPRIVRADGI